MILAPLVGTGTWKCLWILLSESNFRPFLLGLKIWSSPAFSWLAEQFRPEFLNNRFFATVDIFALLNVFNGPYLGRVDWKRPGCSDSSDCALESFWNLFLGFFEEETIQKQEQNYIWHLFVPNFFLSCSKFRFEKYVFFFPHDGIMMSWCIKLILAQNIVWKPYCPCLFVVSVSMADERERERAIKKRWYKKYYTVKQRTYNDNGAIKHWYLLVWLLLNEDSNFVSASNTSDEKSREGESNLLFWYHHHYSLKALKSNSYTKVPLTRS